MTGAGMTHYEHKDSKAVPADSPGVTTEHSFDIIETTLEERERQFGPKFLFFKSLSLSLEDETYILLDVFFTV